MKGIELPINILVIVAIAVIVLIAVIAMFYPAFLGGSFVLSSETARGAACQVFSEAKKCGATTPVTNVWSITVRDFDANKDGSKDNTADTAYPTNCSAAGNAAHDSLSSLCFCYYSITDERRCKALCGC